jgi:predicted permease
LTHFFNSYAQRIYPTTQSGTVLGLKKGLLAIHSLLLEDFQMPNFINSLGQDMRYGLRALLKQPGFTLVAVLTLALGVGANTAIFSVVNSVLISALPYRGADQLAIVWERSQRNAQNTINLGNFFDWKEQNNVFEGMAAFADIRTNLTGAGEPEEIPAQVATDNLFAVLGAQSLLGRTFTSEDGKQGQNNVIILSYSLWQRRFGGDPQIIGRKVVLNNNENTIIGVMPPDFKWHIRKNSLTSQVAELWTPWAVTEQMRGRRGRFASSVARLKPGVTQAQARAEMDNLGRRLAEQYKEFNTGWGVNVVPLREQFAGELRKPLLILLGAVGFVLLIACANVANLLLARAAARQKELSVRAAMGASRVRIVRQLLTESLLLALLGGTAGLLLAVWGTELLVSLSPPELADLQNVRLSASVLGFTFGVTLLTGLIFGLLPAFEATSLKLSETLKETGRSATGSVRSQRLRNALVVAEVALAFVLLVGAGLLIRSFQRLQAVDAGFNPQNVLTLRVSLPRRRYDQDGKIISFFNQAVERIQGLPGVESAGAINFLPLASLGSRTGLEIEGRPPSTPGNRLSTDVTVTDANFFRTMQIQLKRGRFYSAQEVQERRNVVVVNEAFVQKYFPNEEPLGQRVRIAMMDTPAPNEIIGVVGNVKNQKLELEAYPMAYWPMAELTYNAMSFVIRAKSDPTELAPTVRNIIHSLDPQQPVAEVRTLESVLGTSIARERFNTLLLAVFAVVALLLSAIGIYGVMAYAVTQRTHELGIRAALGATATDILRLVLRQGMALAALGVGVGLVAAFGLTRLLATLLFNVSTTDVVTFVGIALLLTLVALVACFIPARRATKVDPLVALRYE